ncbi:Papain inhibitor [Smittium culicis]|uniref:Papain inhibitor n=1 Tax=Smittium culicis TaxID=133412 RepID=A0A1R1XTK7_9FUNG|nr:Papain inhibitor [Smittium culicis]
MFLNLSSGFFVCALFSAINRSVESLPHSLKDTGSLMNTDEDLSNVLNAILDPLSVLNAEEQVEKLNLDDEEGSDDSSSDVKLKRITKNLLDLEQPDESKNNRIKRNILKKLLFSSVIERRSRAVYDDDEDPSSDKRKKSYSNDRDFDGDSSYSAKSATSVIPTYETQIAKTVLPQTSDPKVDQGYFQKNTPPADQGVPQPIQESLPQDRNISQPKNVIDSNSYRFNHGDTNNARAGVKPVLTQPILSSAVQLADQRVIPPQTETLRVKNQMNTASMSIFDHQVVAPRPKINMIRNINTTARSENELAAPMPQQISPSDGIAAQNKKEMLKSGSDNKLNNIDSIQITKDDSEKRVKNSDKPKKDILSVNNNEANKIEDGLAVLHQSIDSRSPLGHTRHGIRRMPRSDIRRIMSRASRRSRFGRGYYGGRFGGRRRRRMGLVSNVQTYNQQPGASDPNHPEGSAMAVPQQSEYLAPANPQQPEYPAPADLQQPEIPGVSDPQTPDTPSPVDPEQPSDLSPNPQQPGQEHPSSLEKQSEINQTDSDSHQVFSGEGTHYDPGVGLGSCGKLRQQTEMVAAMNALQYGNEPNPNNAAICNKCILVSTKDSSGLEKSVKVQIQDKCPPCKYGDVDLSTEAFKKIAPLEIGRIKITWKFVPC